MGSTPVQSAIDDLQASYRRMRPTNTHHWLAIRPQDDRPTYLKAIQRGAWSALELAGTQRRGRYLKLAGELLARREILRQQFVVNRSADEVLTAGFVPPRDRSDWPEMRRGLQAELRRRGASRTYIGRAVAKFIALDADELVRRHRETNRARGTQLDEVAEASFAGLMGAELAVCVAQLNIAAGAPSARLHKSEAFFAATERALAADERQWYQDLRSGKVPTPSLTRPRKLVEQFERSLGYVGAIAAERRQNPEDRELGRLALRGANLIRSLLRNLALRYALAWIGSDHPSSQAYQRWLRSVASRRFQSAFRMPRRISARAAQRATGDELVSVEGLLGAVDIRHVDRVPISHAVLRDRGTISLMTKHRKMDSGGMVKGAFVRVVGRPTRDRAGNPELELVRRRYLDLAGSSWSDWATMQLRAIFEASPQGLATDWSWEPGVDGAGNQLRYKLWYVESRRPKRGGV